MTDGKKRGALLPGLMTLMVLVGASMAGASRPGLPAVITHAKQAVFGGSGSEGASVSGSGPAASGSGNTGSGEATGPQGMTHGRDHAHAAGPGVGFGSQGVGPGGDHMSHRDGNGRDHTGGNGKGNGAPPTDQGIPADGHRRSSAHASGPVSG